VDECKPLEAGLRSAVNDRSVSEVVVTADVSLTAGHLRAGAYTRPLLSST